MSPKQSSEVREARLRQILDAALKIFSRKGLHNTRVSEIATEVGVSQGTIYWYFDSKEDLFATAFKRQFDQLAQPIFEMLTVASRPPADRLLDLAKATFDLVRDHKAIMFIFFQAMTLPDLAEIVTQDFEVYYNQFIAILIPLFEALDDADPASSARLYTALLDGLMLQMLVTHGAEDRARLLAQIKTKFNLKES